VKKIKLISKEKVSEDKGGEEIDTLIKEKFSEIDNLIKKREQEKISRDNDVTKDEKMVKDKKVSKDKDKDLDKQDKDKITKDVITPEVEEESDQEVISVLEEQITDRIQEMEEIEDLVAKVTRGEYIYERKGFGWKGLGSRRIVFNDKIKENVYEVYEPVLSDQEKEIKNKLKYYFRTRTDSTDVTNMDIKQKIKYLEESLDKILKENHITLAAESKDNIYYYIMQDFIGYSKIDILMNDEGIEDIHCDGLYTPLFIHHRLFESIKTNIVYNKIEELDSFVIKLSQICGKQISVYEPIVDGKLEDGSRLQTTLGNTVTKYSTFTIRRFREDPMTPIDLIKNNTFDIDMAAYFWMVIEKGTNMLFCGGTASGKTTALNAMSLFLPSTYKIVSIEDTREINLPHENWIAGTTRTGFASTEDFKTGKDIDMFDLIRVALRQRPRVIIVGEVRGKEAYTLFQAMTTGHLSYSTIHASDMHALIQRLENKPIDLPRALLTSLDLIVFLNSVTVNGEPVRRITDIVEVVKLDPGSNRLVTLTPFQWTSEIDDKFSSLGGSRILRSIKMEYGWTDKDLQRELQNRRDVLAWMIKNNYRSYEDVGRIVSEYKKDQASLMKRVKEDKK
jgi:flagellar protein FlaI